MPGESTETIEKEGGDLAPALSPDKSNAIGGAAIEGAQEITKEPQDIPRRLQEVFRIPGFD